MYKRIIVLTLNNNWIEQIKSDMNSLDIAMTEQSIKDMKKETFKTLLKKKLKEKATDFLFLRSSFD